VVLGWCFVDGIDGDFRRLHCQGLLTAVTDARMRQPLWLVRKKLRVVHPLNDFGFGTNKSGRTHDAVPETQGGVTFK
jgi:hypothetical protein